MKYLKISIVILFFFSFFTQEIFADNNMSDPNKELRSAIKNLVNVTSYSFIDAAEIAYVAFVVNKRSEIVVIDVDSEGPRLSNFVYSRLNYQKIDTDSFIVGNKYFIRLKFI